MNNNLTYYVFPLEPEHKKITLSKKERKYVDGLSTNQTVFLWIVISIGLAVWLGFLSLTKGGGISFPSLTEGVILLSFTGLIAFGIAYLIKTLKILNKERQRTNEANREEKQRVAREAENLTYHLTNNYNSSRNLGNEIPSHLKDASLWLQNAEYEYKSSAFAPFWDAVENGAVHLGLFSDKTRQLTENANSYYRQLQGRRHSFPTFPIQLQAVPDATFVVSEMKRIVRFSARDKNNVERYLKIESGCVFELE